MCYKEYVRYEEDQLTALESDHGDPLNKRERERETEREVERDVSRGVLSSPSPRSKWTQTQKAFLQLQLRDVVSMTI